MNNVIDLPIGQRIKYFRKRSGLSQLALESEIDGAEGTLSRIESGKVNPTKETLYKVALATNLSNTEQAELFGIKIENDASLLQVQHISAWLMSNVEVKKATQRIVDLLAMELLNDLQKEFSFIGCSVSTVDNNARTIQLKYLSNSWVTAISRMFFLRNDGFEPVSLQITVPTLTILSAIDNEIKVAKDLEAFISPPVSRSGARLLQKLGRINSMVAIPISFDGKVIAVTNFALTNSSRNKNLSKKQLARLQEKINYNFREVLGLIV